MKTPSEEHAILVFESNHFLSVDDDGTSDGDLEPFGKDVAQFLIDKLAEDGVSVSSEPKLNETNWYFFVNTDGANRTVFVDWVLLAHSNNSCWAVQFSGPWRGILRELFSRKSDWNDVRDVCESVDRIAQNSPFLTNVRWISMREFGEM